MKAIILAAGVGKRLQEKGKEQPKCFLEVCGIRLVDRYMAALQECGVNDVVFVTGYMADQLEGYVSEKYTNMKVSFIENKEYTKGNILSAYAAKEYFDEPFLLMDADVAFPVELLSRLLTSEKENCLLLDTGFNNDAEEMKLGADANGRVWEIARTLSKEYAVQGEGVGFFKCSPEAGKKFRELLKKQIDLGNEDYEYEHVLDETMKEVEIGYELVAGLPWTEIDFQEDLDKAQTVFS